MDQSASSPAAPGPGSLTWEFAGDPRLMAGAGYALLLQLAHPTVAAGVNQHSEYQAAPWKRLLRTLDYLATMQFCGTAKAIAMARRLREGHAVIRGTDDHGTAYSAFEPEAWNWVQATLADSTISSIEHFGRPLSNDQRDGLWSEFAAVGELIGAYDLPSEWAEYVSYRDAMIAQRLRHDRAIDDFLGTLRAQPAGAIGELAAVGLMPGRLRATLGLRWTHRKQGQFDLLGRTLRLATPLLRGPLRNGGPAYARLRGL